MTGRTSAIHVSYRTAAAITMASFVGIVAFLWPFVIRADRVGGSGVAALLFGLLLVLVVLVVFAEIADGGIDSKAVAMLGVLSAVNAALRPLGAGTAGIETVFFVLVIAGRVFGPGFGFSLGCTSMFASSLLTGGIGPWVPYQMFGCAWVGLFAGLLPRARGRAEVLLLAGYGAVSGYVFGFMLDLSFWPFSVDPHSSIAYLPSASFATQWHRYLLFETTTSLGWDTGRAVTNFLLILLVAPIALTTFRRAARRAAFEAPVAFETASAADAAPTSSV